MEEVKPYLFQTFHSNCGEIEDWINEQAAKGYEVQQVIFDEVLPIVLMRHYSVGTMRRSIMPVEEEAKQEPVSIDKQEDMVTLTGYAYSQLIADATIGRMVRDLPMDALEYCVHDTYCPECNVTYPGKHDEGCKVGAFMEKLKS